MSETIEKRLSDLGVVLPVPATPAANYVPTVATGRLLFTSGQLNFDAGKLSATGIVGRDLDTAAAKHAARFCAINVLAQAKVALGDLSRIVRAVKLTVFVASAPDFTEQHLVANGASDLIVAALGEPGRHARSAIGMAALPLNAPVEVEAIFEIA
jgi:enamine deaminase RidA (YjgF/YER057c/UK114 family)